MPKAIARDRDGVRVVAEGAMTMESVRPAGSLAPLVARICSYGESASRVASRRELPSGCADLIFNLGQDLRIEHPVDVETTFGAGEAFYTGSSGPFGPPNAGSDIAIDRGAVAVRTSRDSNLLRGGQIFASRRRASDRRALGPGANLEPSRAGSHRGAGSRDRM